MTSDLRGNGEMARVVAVSECVASQLATSVIFIGRLRPGPGGIFEVNLRLTSLTR